MINYISTRGKSESKRSAEAIIQGIANDKGLFVPDRIPLLSFKPEQKIGSTYKYVAFHVMQSFLQDFTEEELKKCIDGAYEGTFESVDVAPLVKTKKSYFLELFHGRTAAFKDLALSIMPYLMLTSMMKENEDKRVAILTATSGDTGKAALEGFSDVPGTEIIVFYPKDGVSQVQERQMITQMGKNTHVFAIYGNFDDAQTGVKRLFDDEGFAASAAAKGYRLSSANSINIGRLIPQVVYYVYAYIKMIENGAVQAGAPINIVVPTGNFGNILAAYYAREMGIPVNRFICASNRNKVLTEFINTGVYDANREFYMTNSPSMDILISSNLERLLYHLSGGDSAAVLRMMESLGACGRYEIDGTIRDGLKSFYGGCADVEETNAAIGRLYEEEKYLIDTHTAVAYKVYEDYRKESGDETPTVIAATANPYKFADSVAASIGLAVDADGFANIRAVNASTGVRVPDSLRNLEGKEVRHRGTISIDSMAEAVLNSLA
ncbi:MAG: threonine synthase [Clostridiales Family XIII bacterium]|nr:threonine synthase [Clostridiales Family XIII bacterium]